MTTTLTDDEVRRWWLRGQRLDGSVGPGGVAATVGTVAGLQAQDPAAAMLGVWARGGAVEVAAVERALVTERAVVRTWAMRGTLHLLAAADVRALVALTGPSALAGMRRRHATLGIAGETGARGVGLIRDTLAAHGPQTRADLAAALAGQGVPAAGQALFHLIVRAALEGQICHGPPAGREPTYVVLDDWLGPGTAPERSVALADLARRYLAAYGPATVADFAGWAGLPAADARAGWESIAGQRRAVRTSTGPAWVLAGAADSPPPPPPSSWVRLLPAFDSYLLGHRSRALVVPAAHARLVHPGGGIIHPVLLVDGQAAGSWRLARRGAGVVVAVAPFAPLPPTVVAGVQDAAGSLGRFLGQPATARIEPPAATVD